MTAAEMVQAMYEGWRHSIDPKWSTNHAINKDGDYVFDYRCHRCQAEALAAKLRAEPAPPEPASCPTMSVAAEMLWIVLANVSEGDWSKQSQEWQEAAQRWRDYYFKALDEEKRNQFKQAAEPTTDREALKRFPIYECIASGYYCYATKEGYFHCSPCPQAALTHAKEAK